ncbi:PilZ domain-containing protein [Stakelama tenebrarum]|nr:PilZ domain-containing protein [Sphingosinithalassobacter tenebrarum]
MLAFDNGDALHQQDGRWQPRNSKRSVSTLLTARLVSDRVPDQPCRIRNVSTGGMMIEFRVPLVVGDTVAVELRTGERLDASIVWTNAGRAGLQFFAPRDMTSILTPANRAAPGKGKAPRAPRFETCSAVRIGDGCRSYPARLIDISQSGGHIAIDESIALGGALWILIPDLSPRPISVRWRRGGEAGIAFGQMIPYGELAVWLADSSRRFSAA